MFLMEGLIEAVTDKIAFYFSRTPRSGSDIQNYDYAKSVALAHLPYIEKRAQQLIRELPGPFRCNRERCKDALAEELSSEINW